MIFGLELVHKKDAMHYRRSGLNQVLCKIAASKSKKIGFDFWSLMEPRVLGRVKQNIKFCKKYKVDYFLGAFAEKPELMRSFHDLKSFLKTLDSLIKKNI